VRRQVSCRCATRRSAAALHIDVNVLSWQNCQVRLGCILVPLPPVFPGPDTPARWGADGRFLPAEGSGKGFL
jgi:hypothetical protein